MLEHMSGRERRYGEPRAESTPLGLPLYAPRRTCRWPLRTGGLATLERQGDPLQDVAGTGRNRLCARPVHPPVCHRRRRHHDGNGQAESLRLPLHSLSPLPGFRPHLASSGPDVSPRKKENAGIAPEKRARSFSSMSRVMASRSYSGFHPHSSRAQVSSSELGHDSAMP